MVAAGEVGAETTAASLSSLHSAACNVQPVHHTPTPVTTVTGTGTASDEMTPAPFALADPSADTRPPPLTTDGTRDADHDQNHDDVAAGGDAVHEQMHGDDGDD